MQPYKLIRHKKSNSIGVMVWLVILIVLFSMVILSSIGAMDKLHDEQVKQATQAQNLRNF